jgi:chloramphenicol 3-O-phosphotransferase
MIGGVALFVISGISAAGKSTVARPDAGGEALRQLVLRYAGALAGAGVFLDGGFDVVVEDVIIGHVLPEFLELIPVPEFHLVFLDLDAAAIQQREQERDRVAYGPDRWSVNGLQAILREQTDRIRADLGIIDAAEKTLTADAATGQSSPGMAPSQSAAG